MPLMYTCQFCHKTTKDPAGWAQLAIGRISFIACEVCQDLPEAEVRDRISKLVDITGGFALVSKGDKS